MGDTIQYRLAIWLMVGSAFISSAGAQDEGPVQRDTRSAAELSDDLRDALDEERSLAARTPPPPLLQNLVVALAGGAVEDVDADQSAFGSVGAAMGFGLPVPFHLGIQGGGSATRREGHRFDLQLSGGVSLRDVEVEPLDAAFGLGLLVDYLHTRDDADLFAFRPMMGLSFGEDDHVWVRGVLPLNESTIERNSGDSIEQRLLPRIDLALAHEFSDRIAGELRLGRQEGDADAFVVGASVGAALGWNLSLVASGESNLDGDFAAGLTFQYQFGSYSRAATVTRFRSLDENDDSPLPMRSFTEVLLETRR